MAGKPERQGQFQADDGARLRSIVSEASDDNIGIVAAGESFYGFASVLLLDAIG